MLKVVESGAGREAGEQLFELDEIDTARSAADADGGAEDGSRRLRRASSRGASRPRVS